MAPIDKIGWIGVAGLIGATLGACISLAVIVLILFTLDSNPELVDTSDGSIFDKGRGTLNWIAMVSGISAVLSMAGRWYKIRNDERMGARG